jgi:predicted lipoprotein with Yx(FWY)xxD motif
MRIQVTVLAAAGTAAVAMSAAACSSSSSSGSAGGAPSSAPASASSAPASASSAPASASSAPASSAAAASGALKTAQISGVTVITNAKGFTLYSFAPDTATKSNCNGACAQIWPPVTGAVTAGPGVTGKLGTITRSDGSTQATYDGHPLYTYVADTAPGQASGNGINANGGLWHEVTVAGTTAASNSGGSGGY